MYDELNQAATAYVIRFYVFICPLKSSLTGQSSRKHPLALSKAFFTRRFVNAIPVADSCNIAVSENVTYARCSRVSFLRQSSLCFRLVQFVRLVQVSKIMMMDEIEVAAVWLLHKRNAKRKVNRKLWVHAATVSSV